MHNSRGRRRWRPKRHPITQIVFLGGRIINHGALDRGAALFGARIPWRRWMTADKKPIVEERALAQGFSAGVSPPGEQGLGQMSS